MEESHLQKKPHSTPNNSSLSLCLHFTHFKLSSAQRLSRDSETSITWPCLGQINKSPHNLTHPRKHVKDDIDDAAVQERDQVNAKIWRTVTTAAFYSSQAEKLTNSLRPIERVDKYVSLHLLPAGKGEAPRHLRTLAHVLDSPMHERLLTRALCATAAQWQQL